MSSGSLCIPTSAEMFEWSENFDSQQFIFATYKVASCFSGKETALGMAMEQSAATVYIKDYVEPSMLEAWSIRIKNVKTLAEDFSSRQVAPYFLATEVYGGNKEPNIYLHEIELAIPINLVGGKPAQLLNIVVGELPRLGFLTAFSLADIEFPKGFGCGPSFGQAGIYQLLNKTSGPLLCRSMRPGLGLSTSVMAQLHRDVLTGGFHLVKDDELIYFSTNEDFRHHIINMMQARDDAIKATGERKLYIANLLCEPNELQTRWEMACELGVDAVLIAPFIQGLGTLQYLAKQGKLPILAHNAFGDILSRHTSWGISGKATCKILRELGADWFVTPGGFGTENNEAYSAEIIDVSTQENVSLKNMLPIMQGGKKPDELPQYRQAIGSDNFMLIVASWVDGHPEGLINGAKIFRQAVDNLA